MNSKILKVLTVFITIVVLSSCGSTKQIAQTQYFKLPYLGFDTESQVQTKSEISIKVTRTGIENSKFIASDNYVQTISYYYYGAYNTYVRTANVRVVPYYNCTAIDLEITNNTGHILKFENSLVVLETPTGQSVYSISKEDIENKPSILPYYDYLLKKYSNPIVSTFDAAIINVVGHENILSKSDFILPGKTLKTVALFPVASEGFDSGKLIFYDIPVKTDAAGNTSEKTMFEFDFKRNITFVKLVYNEAEKKYDNKFIKISEEEYNLNNKQNNN